MGDVCNYPMNLWANIQRGQGTMAEELHKLPKVGFDCVRKGWFGQIPQYLAHWLASFLADTAGVGIDLLSVFRGARHSDYADFAWRSECWSTGLAAKFQPAVTPVEAALTYERG
jgi:hypothetical protein